MKGMTNMLCENCKKNTATTHLKQTINGKKDEIFLCSECASKMGLMDFSPSFGFGEMLLNLVGQPTIKNNSITGKTCSFCGLTENDVYKNGKVGCEKCYEIFEGRLTPLINKIHGSKRHVGKRPLSKGFKKKEITIEDLKKQLDEAIKAENFEQAAILRDKIKEMGA